MIVSVGLSTCWPCNVRPTYEIIDCGHQICTIHSKNALINEQQTRICGQCGSICSGISRIEHITPTHSPIRRTGRKHTSSGRASPTSYNSIVGTSRTTEGNEESSPESTMDPSTQSGSSQYGSGNVYVPPMLRGEEVRPESSMSNATFTSQAPLTQNHGYGQQSGFQPSFVQRPNAQYPPSNNYSFGPSNTMPSMGPYDPFQNQASSRVPQPTRPAPHSFLDRSSFPSSMSSAGMCSGYTNQGMGYNGFNTAVGQNTQNNQTTGFNPAFNTAVGQSTRNNQNTGFNTGFNTAIGQSNQTNAFNPALQTQELRRRDTMERPSNHEAVRAHQRNMSSMSGKEDPVNQRASTPSSNNDSTAPHAARAWQLAQMIMRGECDNPSDPDYGNPGPSRRGGNTNGPSASSSIPTGYRSKVADTTSNTVASKGAHHVNINGNAAVYVGTDPVPPPSWLPYVQNGHSPSIEDMFECLPLVEGCRKAEPNTAGVIRIRNIPYQTSRAEIIAFVGRNAQIISQPPGSPYHAVHIIMERHTGKTMDAFVEVTKASEALFLVNQFKRRLTQGRQAKVGDRAVEVELSTQQELMFELFPRAKHTTWEAGGVPEIDPSKPEFFPGVPSSGFQGFLQDEEIVLMTKHAETPQRSPFAQRCLIRCYESLISTLHKYPWYDVEHVYLDERRMLYDSTVATIKALMALLRRTHNKPHTHNQKMPTPAVLQELAVAALTCPGFAESQKANIVATLHNGSFSEAVHIRGMAFRIGGTNIRFSQDWPFQVLIKKPGAPDEVVQLLADLLRRATTNSQQVSLADSFSKQHTKHSVFGDVKIDYGNAETLAEAATIELRAIEQLLGRVLPSRRAIGNGSGSRASSGTQGSGSGGYSGGGHSGGGHSGGGHSGGGYSAGHHSSGQYSQGPFTQGLYGH